MLILQYWWCQVFWSQQNQRFLFILMNSPRQGQGSPQLFSDIQWRVQIEPMHVRTMVAPSTVRYFPLFSSTWYLAKQSSQSNTNKHKTHMSVFDYQPFTYTFYLLLTNIYIQLDGQTLTPCPADIIILKNLTENQEHNFLLNITTRNGERSSSAYSWFIGKQFLCFA